MQLLNLDNLVGKIWSRRNALAIALTLMLGTSPVFADPLQGQLLFQAGNKHMEQGDYKSALQDYQSSITNFSQPGLEKFKAIVVNSLGITYWRLGLYPQAEKLFRESLEMSSQTGGKNTVQYAATLNNLALMLQNQSNYAEAEALFKKSEEINKAAGSANEACCLCNLAGVYQDQGHFDEAESAYKKALAMSVAKGDEEQAATTINNLGTLYLDEDMYEEAERYFKKALAKTEKLSGTQSSNYAIICGSIGKAYARQGRYDEAVPLLLSSQKIKEQTLGPEHPMVATGLVSLAEIDLDQGKLDEANEKLDKALSIRQAKLGPQSPDTAQVIDLLGELALKQNDPKQAQEYFKQALAIRESTLGPGNPLTGKSKMLIGDALVDQKLYQQAETLYKQAIDLNTRTLGHDSARVALNYDKLNKLYLLMGKQADADRAADASLQIKRKLPGGARLKASQETASAVHPPGDTTKPPAAVPIGEKWALVVGISNYQDNTLNLRYSAKDARDFYEYLLKDGHFKGDHAKLLVDSDASRENIMSLLGDSWLPKNVKPNDLVVLYVSSHGSPSEMDVKGENYLVVFDTKKDKLYATGISMQDLIDKIKHRVNTERVLIVLDACHSGATREGAKGLYRAQNFDSDAITQGTGQMVICSSSPDQSSWESKNYPNGVFTRQLIDALKQKNGKVTIS
ncbi:MAG: tetratricopeptide repeat protein, partial [Cyanobacteria bacterium SZAS LIN-2]|nr:tetratricopeptide repeat protein [Cyanobacteria bacterium SZAS LIN-2]